MWPRAAVAQSVRTLGLIADHPLAHRAGTDPDGDGHRGGGLAELRTARLTGIRVAVPVEALEGRLASLPEGVKVARDRIEVRFSGAQEAVARLYALAQVLSNDYDRFETLVGRGEVSE